MSGESGEGEPKVVDSQCFAQQAGAGEV